MTIFESLWRLLPDKCEMPDCCRQGVRGNENIVDGIVMCDYCHAIRMQHWWSVAANWRSRQS